MISVFTTSTMAGGGAGAGGAAGQDNKEHVRVATVGQINIPTALNTGDTLNGITLAANDRVLVAHQQDVAQVETATVLGTVTGSGNARLIVTSAGMTGSPITVDFAVVNTDTASQVATKARTALGLNAVIAARFTIGGSAADITLTRAAAATNDTTLNLSIANSTSTGLTSAPTSANTTAGSLAAENGIWLAGTTPSRPNDADTWNELTGASVVVTEGTYGRGLWWNTNAAGGTLGTTAVTWVNAENPAGTLGSYIYGGPGNTITSQAGLPLVYGTYSSIVSGYNNTITNNANGSTMGGANNSITGAGLAVVTAFGERIGVVSYGSGDCNTVLGSQHIGGITQDVSYLGGFHNLVNCVGTTDYGTGGAQIGAVGSGTLLTYLGGFNMVVMGAGAVAEVQGSRAFCSHGNKNKGFLDFTVVYSSTNAASGTVAAGATVTVELLPMEYYSGANLKKFAVIHKRCYTVEFDAIITLVHATTPLIGIIKKRARYTTGTTVNDVPTLLSTVTTIESKGNNAGALPDVAWDVVITPEAGALTFDATVKNTSAGALNIHAIAYVTSTWIATDLDT